MNIRIKLRYTEEISLCTPVEAQAIIVISKLSSLVWMALDMLVILCGLPANWTTESPEHVDYWPINAPTVHSFR